MDYYQKNHTQQAQMLRRKKTQRKKNQIKCGLFFGLLPVDETKDENLRNSQGFDEFITEFAGKK